jgi:hypothetical protein
VEAVGKCSASFGRSGGGSEAMGTAKWRWPWSKRSRHKHAVVRTRQLMGGPQRFQIFFNLSKTGSTLKIQNRLNFKNQKLYLNPKIPNFCMQIARNIGNNFLNCAYFKFQTETKLKNPITDSVFESLMNFKRDSNLWEKSDKFSKIPS